MDIHSSIRKQAMFSVPKTKQLSAFMVAREIQGGSRPSVRMNKKVGETFRQFDDLSKKKKYFRK